MNRLWNDLHWGFFVASKGVWVVNMAILLKVFHAPIWAYPVAVISITGIILITGELFNKYFRKGFINGYYDDTNVTNKK